MKIFFAQKLHTALDALWTFSHSSDVCQPSLWIARMPFIWRLSWMTWCSRTTRRVFESFAGSWKLAMG